jgi:hypothetical protein
MSVRAFRLAVAVAAGVALTMVALATVRAGRAEASGTPLTLPPTAPPELLALTAKMEALTVETERVSLTESIAVLGHGPEAALLRKLVGAFGVSVSGEVRRNPEEGSLTITLFGVRLRVLALPGHTYLFGGARLARRDGGRPWVDLGSKGLGALLPTGRTKTVSTPGAPTFARIATILRAPIAVTTLGGGTIDGVTVSGFRETLDPKVFEAPASLAGIAPTGSFATRATRAAAESPSVTAEAFIAADGLPVRTRFVQVSGPVHLLVQVDIPAIDFPLTLEAPKPAQVIDLAALKRLEREHRVPASAVTGH